MACAIAGSLGLASNCAANAMPLGAIGATAGTDVSSSALLHHVQRPGRGGPRVGGGRGGPRVGGGRAIRGGVVRGGRTAGGNARRNRNNALGAAAAIGVGAALLGAIAGSANRNRAPQEEVYEERPRRVYRDRDYEERPRYRRSRSSSVDYCSRKYRSYNPRTGMYRGFDGQYYPCP